MFCSSEVLREWSEVVWDVSEHHWDMSEAHFGASEGHWGVSEGHWGVSEGHCGMIEALWDASEGASLARQTGFPACQTGSVVPWAGSLVVPNRSSQESLQRSNRRPALQRNRLDRLPRQVRQQAGTVSPKCSKIGRDEKHSANNSRYPANNRPNAINSVTVIAHLLV